MEQPKIATRMRMLGALSSALGRLPESAKLLIETTKTAVAAAQRQAYQQAAAPKLNRKQRRVRAAQAKITARHARGL